MHTLRQKADILLGQTLIPGKDQARIRESLRSLDEVLEELVKQQPETAQTILMKSQDLYYQVERQRLSSRASAQMRAGFAEMADILTDLLGKYEHEPISAKRVIISADSLAEQRALSNVSVQLEEFRHIPYVSAQSDAGILSELRAHGTTGHLEKLYYALPLQQARAQPGNLERIGATQAWKHSAGDGVRIGIIDGGCNVKHAEIYHAFTETHGYDFVAGSKDIRERSDHATHVAGVIAGSELGVAANATLYSLRIFNRHTASESAFLKAMEWAIDNKLDILNASFGSRRESPAEKMMCEALHKNGIDLVAAAGNDGDSAYLYPASYTNTISVAAVDKHNKRARFSQRNDQLTISAPGVGIYSCTARGYGSMSGTSMAAPHVTGALALMRSVHADRDAMHELKIHAYALGRREEYGAGLVRADRMVR